MIPAEILKKIRQIELKTKRLVSEKLAGQYQSVFKGQGMDFDEVREYQPGDEVRAIDWNVTARMNHPFVKKFKEERELTVLLVVDVSGSGLFGSGKQSKRDLAAEIASVLAFSAIRNNDKVGLILFSEGIEKFIPPRKGRAHVLRVIREILFFEPQKRGTDLNTTIDFIMKVIRHKSIVVVVSDFMGQTAPSRKDVLSYLKRKVVLSENLGQASFFNLRQINRRHDLIAIQIIDKYELDLPKVGKVVLRDAETDEVLEVDTGDKLKRVGFRDRQQRSQSELVRLFRSANIDTIPLKTGEDYSIALAHFFETREKRQSHR